MRPGATDGWCGPDSTVTQLQRVAPLAIQPTSPYTARTNQTISARIARMTRFLTIRRIISHSLLLMYRIDDDLVCLKLVRTWQLDPGVDT